MNFQYIRPLSQYRPNARQRFALNMIDGESNFDEPRSDGHATHFPETCIRRVGAREIVSSRRVVVAIEKTKTMPAVHQNILRGRYDVAKFLMEVKKNGTDLPLWDVNEIGPFDWTALHVLAQCYEQYDLHSVERLKLLDELAAHLIEQGADVMAKDCFGMNPLASANGKGPPSLRRATAEAVAKQARIEDQRQSEDGKRGAYEKR
ncbi:hypothetical protein [Pseudoxanthomonas mexicana]